MTQHGYQEDKEQLIKRLNRAEGQVRGITRMIQEDTYCIEVLTQINAAQAALDKVALELLRDHARHCLNNETVLSRGKGDKADDLLLAGGQRGKLLPQKGDVLAVSPPRSMRFNCRANSVKQLLIATGLG